MSKVEKYLSEYLDSRSVFLIDLALSFVSSFAVLLMLNYVTKSSYDSFGFAVVWLGSSCLGMASAMLVVKSYRVIIRHTSIRDLVGFVIEVMIKGTVMLVVMGIATHFTSAVTLALVFDVLMTLTFLLFVRIVMVTIYDQYKGRVDDLQERKRIFVYGTSDKSAAVITRLQNSPHFKVVGLITYEALITDLKLGNVPVYSYSDEEHLLKLLNKYSVTGILFASEKDARSEEHGLLDFCLKNKIRSLILPSVEDVAAGKIMKNNVRDVKIEDLLGREEIKVSMDEIRESFKDKVVMVTGAAGSIGSELCRQLASFDVREIVLFDNAETPMHYIRLELEERFPRLRFVPIIGDVRIETRLDFAFRKYKPQVVFHAAAYKHVPLMEENPCEAVLVNVHGTRNVADKCLEYGVEKMIMISTDKAVNPTNIMGCSKRLAEIYVQSLALAIENGKKSGVTRFITTRFGNVLGSNGSVIPRFREQIEKGGPVTVTHPEINRFFMTIPEACRLVMEAATIGLDNRIFVFDMGEPVKIVNLAKRMIELSGLKLGIDIEIQYTGLRPGEKLYEEVLATSENTDPTSHDRIRIARTRDYEYEDVLNAVNDLARYSRAVEIPEMVMLMKEVVPEFKSKNSRFEEYDK